MSTESITDRVLRDVLNSDTLGVYCGSDAFINAKRWRFLEAALAVLEERGMLADPADYLAPAEPFDAAEATSAPLDPSKVKAGDTVMSYDALDALPVGSVVLEGSSGAVIPGVLPTMPGVFHRFPDGWYVVAGQGARDDIDFPVTVLHVPAHQPAPEPEKDLLAETIWKASRADEGTISATGANHVAAAIRNLFVVIDPAAVDWRGLQSQMSVLVVGAEPFKRAGDILDVVRRELGIEATR